MTSPVAPLLPYASQPVGLCPLCATRPVIAKTIYGHPVCKKCFYRFANRRQLGYVLDSLFSIVPFVLLTFGIDFLIAELGVRSVFLRLFNIVITFGLMSLYVMKDGFNGFSPGKWICDIQVLDTQSGQPIGYGQSFRRNCVLLWGCVPVVGGLISLVLLVVIAVQVGRGPRLGDKIGETKAIWKRFAHTAVFGGQALVCEGCGYDLHGNTSGVCPECGKAVSEHNQAMLAAERDAAVTPTA